MQLPPDQNTERRPLIRSRFAEPLFDFVFDDETLESDYSKIARIAIESRYPGEELAAIYWCQVLPAKAGSWSSIDPLDSVWLKQRIRHRPIVGCLLTLFF